MKKTALVIMAAGIGSRFGGGIKQLEPVGMNNEIIMDYSIHDAIKAGFNRIVIVIRKDIEADFKERIGDRIQEICDKKGVEFLYAFQDIRDIPGKIPEGRTKPWGTGQAVLAAKNCIDSPFLVINADDYYGKEAFEKMHDWLCDDHHESTYSMAGFILKNTLSENGGVTRGVCKVKDGHQYIIEEVVETSNIIKTANGAEANGVPLDEESYVSMNMWGLPLSFLKILEDKFTGFFTREVPENPLKAEYLLPSIIGGMLKDQACTVSVVETRDKWFGVTYKEDKPLVVESFKDLIARGAYPELLYSDI